MAYTKQTWVNNETHLNATRMNHIEDGIYNIDQQLNEINAGDNSETVYIEFVISEDDTIESYSNSPSSIVDSFIQNKNIYAKVKINFSNGYYVKITPVNINYGNYLFPTRVTGMAYFFDIDLEWFKISGNSEQDTWNINTIPYIDASEGVLSVMCGQFSAGNHTIIGLVDPVNNTDAATKQYVDQVVQNATILSSSTEGSTKRFKITVDDSGTLTATEIV